MWSCELAAWNRVPHTLGGLPLRRGRRHPQVTLKRPD